MDCTPELGASPWRLGGAVYLGMCDFFLQARSFPAKVLGTCDQRPAPGPRAGDWGLIPSWSKDPSVAARMINARSETASARPAFRDALRFRRCLIPADGFYEWARTAKGKQPYCFEINEGSCSRSQEYGMHGRIEAATP